jgi:hypothetical protein
MPSLNTTRIAQDLLEKGLLFSTPFSISQADQNEIIRHTVENNSIVDAENHHLDPFWLGLGLTSIPDKNIQELPAYLKGRWYYYMRMNSRMGWVWNESPAASLVQKLLIPLEPYFKCFTRVSVLLQIPNSALPPHRDLVPFNEYDNMDNPHFTLKGDKKLTYLGEDWLTRDPKNISDVSHVSQGYLNLKIPLSANPHSPGLPYIVYKGEKIYYNSQKKLLFLNEIDVEHGGDPVDFYRGVVFVDGIFNPNTFPQMPREQVLASTHPNWG